MNHGFDGLFPKLFWKAGVDEGGPGATEQCFETNLSEDVLFGCVADRAALVNSVATAEIIEGMRDVLASTIAIDGLEGSIVLGFDTGFVLDEAREEF